jgi:hypothetical protein
MEQVCEEEDEGCGKLEVEVHSVVYCGTRFVDIYVHLDYDRR